MAAEAGSLGGVVHQPPALPEIIVGPQKQSERAARHPTVTMLARLRLASPPDNLMKRARWLLLGLLLINVALHVPRLFLPSSLSPFVRLSGGIALTALGVLWLKSYWRGSFSKGSYLVEGPLVWVCTLAVADPLHMLRVLYFGVVFRSLYGSPRSVAAGAAAYFLGHIAAIPFATAPSNASRLDEVALQAIGFALVASVIHLMGVALISNERAEHALRQSEERFRQLSASAPVGIFQTDRDGRCIYTNARWQGITGSVPDEAVNLDWLSIVHPEDQPSVTGKWQEATSAGAEFASRCRMLLPSGQVGWVDMRATPLHAARVLSGYVGTLEDVTQRRVAEAEQEARARLDGAMLVARTVAHEINNALGPIVGYADLLASRASVVDDPLAMQFVRYITDAGEDAAARVQRLQRVIRLEETTTMLGPRLPLLDLDRSTTTPAPAGQPLLSPTPASAARTDRAQ